MLKEFKKTGISPSTTAIEYNDLLIAEFKLQAESVKKEILRMSPADENFMVNYAGAQGMLRNIYEQVEFLQSMNGTK